MKENALKEFIFGKTYAEKLNKLYDGLLAIEARHTKSLKNGELSPYLIISYSEIFYKMLYREDLPAEIQNEITVLSDSIFKD